MNYLFIDKQNYGSELSGPQLRYLNLAKELVKQKHYVTIACRSYRHSLEGVINFVRLAALWRFLQCLRRAEVVVVHGGGPWVHMLLLPFMLTGRRFFYDGYTFHWMEVYNAYLRSKYPLAKAMGKLYVHWLRWQLVVHAYDGVLCANKRQLDYLRGGIFFSSRLAAERRVGIVPLGCEEPLLGQCGRSCLVTYSKGTVTADDFLVGWVGGVWPWLDFEPVLKVVAGLAESCPRLSLVFFGVKEQLRNAMVKQFAVLGGDPLALKFLPYVPYDQRLKVWSGLDVAIVWGVTGVENDYASRTRNYDCISIGLPVVQNHDDQWGAIITQNDCGIVTDAAGLPSAIALLYNEEKYLARFRDNMRQMQTAHSWKNAACDLHEFVSSSNYSRAMRWSGLLAYALFLPFMLIFGVAIILRDLLYTRSLHAPN